MNDTFTTLVRFKVINILYYRIVFNLAILVWF